jgi:hypothetical protein
VECYLSACITLSLIKIQAISSHPDNEVANPIIGRILEDEIEAHGTLEDIANGGTFTPYSTTRDIQFDFIYIT